MYIEPTRTLYIHSRSTNYLQIYPVLHFAKQFRAIKFLGCSAEKLYFVPMCASIKTKRPLKQGKRGDKKKREFRNGDLILSIKHLGRFWATRPKSVVNNKKKKSPPPHRTRGFPRIIWRRLMNHDASYTNTSIGLSYICCAVTSNGEGQGGGGTPLPSAAALTRLAPTRSTLAKEPTEVDTKSNWRGYLLPGSY